MTRRMTTGIVLIAIGIIIMAILGGIGNKMIQEERSKTTKQNKEEIIQYQDSVKQEIIENSNSKTEAVLRETDSIKKSISTVENIHNDINNNISKINSVAERDLEKDRSIISIQNNRLLWVENNGQRGVQICFTNTGKRNGVIKVVKKYLMIGDFSGRINEFFPLNQTIPENSTILPLEKDNNLICTFHSLDFKKELPENKNKNLYFHLNLIYEDQITKQRYNIISNYTWSTKFSNSPIWHLANNEEKKIIERHLNDHPL